MVSAYQPGEASSRPPSSVSRWATVVTWPTRSVATIVIEFAPSASATPVAVKPRQPPAWWIYILSAAVGVLLLVIIIMVLTKVGFFQRNRPLDEEDDSEFMVSAHFEKVHLNGNGMDSL